LTRRAASVREGLRQRAEQMLPARIAKLVRGMIKEHLALFGDIEKGGMRG
jgi:hypothetical protein